MSEKQDGEALLDRYEIRDKETGEILDEPAYVLRPRSDEIARTAMAVYATLCDIPRRPETQMVTRPLSNPISHRDELNERVIQFIDPASRPDVLDGDFFSHFSDKGPGADGSTEYAYKILESLGMEPVAIVTRAVSQKRKNEAKDWLEEKDRPQREEWKRQAEEAGMTVQDYLRSQRKREPVLS